MGTPAYHEYLGLRTHGATITHVHGCTGTVTLLAVSVWATMGETIISQNVEYLDGPLRRCGWCHTPNHVVQGISEGWTEHDPHRSKYCCRTHTQNAAQDRRRHATARMAGYRVNAMTHL
jgi:hypothetical protein